MNGRRRRAFRPVRKPLAGSGGDHAVHRDAVAAADRAGTSDRPACLPSPTVRIGLFSFATTAAVGGFALLGGAPGVLTGLLVTGCCLAVSPHRAARLACLLRGRRRLGREPDLPLRRRLDGLAARAGRPAPLLVSVSGEDANAVVVATGRGAAVLLSRAMLDGPARELDAVLAHELAHLARRDPLLVASLLAGGAVLFSVALAAATGDASLGARLARFGPHEEMLPHLSLLLGTALVAIAVGLRQRLEWSADAGAAVLLDEPESLILALRARRRQLGPGPGRRALDTRLARLGAGNVPS